MYVTVGLRSSCRDFCRRAFALFTLLQVSPASRGSVFKAYSSPSCSTVRPRMLGRVLSLYSV